MPKITSINERIVFNSRGDKTVEVDVVSDNQYLGRACAPSGASVGIYEAQSFINNNPKKTIEVFKDIKKNFIGLESDDLKTIHETLRGI